MSLVTDILTYDQLQDLWGAGYTVVRRQSDPFEIDPKLIPRGMSYQWNDAKDKPGWRQVPFSRHEGVFGPWGMPGDVYRDKLFLCERPKIEVEAELAQYRTKAEQNVEDWVDKAAAIGFTGEVKVGDKLHVVERPETKTIETTVKIPPDMIPHMEAIFKERDRLEAEIVQKDRTLKPGPIADRFYGTIDAAVAESGESPPWWPTLRAILLPLAIDKVRADLGLEGPALKRIKQEIADLKKETTDE